jgi:hypothetical protein
LGPKGGEVEVDAYLYDSVNVEPEALDEEFIRIAADLAYWNERYARAHKAHLLAKLDAERAEAVLLLEVRETALTEWRAAKLASAGAKDKGESAGREPAGEIVRARMVSDPRYHEVRLAELEAEVERTRLRGVVSALEAKKDMLQSIGAKLRSEMSDPLLRSALARNA